MSLSGVKDLVMTLTEGLLLSAGIGVLLTLSTLVHSHVFPHAFGAQMPGTFTMADMLADHNSPVSIKDTHCRDFLLPSAYSSAGVLY